MDRAYGIRFNCNWPDRLDWPYWLDRSYRRYWCLIYCYRAYWLDWPYGSGWRPYRPHRLDRPYRFCLYGYRPHRLDWPYGLDWCCVYCYRPYRVDWAYRLDWRDWRCLYRYRPYRLDWPYDCPSKQSDGCLYAASQRRRQAHIDYDWRRKYSLWCV
jgi:hypothetical protein